ncbi:MAG: hypothetical protein AAGB22_02390 [Bacteroidota bacterium]
MKQLLATLAIVVGLAAPALAQETTLTPQERPDPPAIPDSLLRADSAAGQLLIIPFEPRMYRSDIDRALGEANRLNSGQLRQNFRQAISNALFIQAGDERQPLALLDTNPDRLQDLRYIYQSIAYQYIPVPPQPEPAPKNLKEKLQRKLRKKPEAPVVGTTSVEQGEVRSARGNARQYMNTRVTNPRMVAFLTHKYEADYLLFVNEMDVLLASSNTQQQYGSDEYLREVSVHFTILDRHGEQVTGGLASTTFSSRTNDLRKIIRQAFPTLADQVLSQLDLSIASALPEGEESAQ